ncbi:MAG: hypothetical protein PHZ07_00255 [Patescibacteria group bacterium]|nr:hypothetical protein [Patescibacteria group bacterium]MDD4304158.1 hypothetical protein [Patescibacteria group bacterium]MDD4695189.1 hypothetical protein [Patescibacteria group bacterium]
MNSFEKGNLAQNLDNSTSLEFEEKSEDFVIDQKENQQEELMSLLNINKVELQIMILELEGYLSQVNFVQHLKFNSRVKKGFLSNNIFKKGKEILESNILESKTSIKRPSSKISSDIIRELDIIKKIFNFNVLDVDPTALNFLLKALQENDLDRVSKIFKSGNEYGVGGLNKEFILDVDEKSENKLLEIEDLSKDKKLISDFYKLYGNIVISVDNYINRLSDYCKKFTLEDLDKDKLKEIIFKDLHGSVDEVMEILMTTKEKSDQSKKIKYILEELSNKFIKRKTVTKHFLAIFIDSVNMKNPKDDKSKLFFERLKLNMERVILDESVVDLPINFNQEIEHDIREYKPEIKNPHKKQVYIPMGVSSDMGFVANDKPLEALKTLLWAQNQNTDIKFRVIDSIQENNYRALGIDEDSANSMSRRKGFVDREWYEEYNKGLKLSNDILGYEGRSRFDDENKYLDDLCDRDKSFQSCFNTMIEPKLFERAKEKIHN